MPFKIVRTLEKGKYSHWIVPSSWECNNIVKWPKRNVSKLVRCEDYEPDPDWRQLKCQVKRNHIPTYKDAEWELNNLLCVTDTDDDQINAKMTKSNEQELNFNALVEQVTNQYNPPVLSVPVESNEPAQIILSSDNQIIDVPMDTYCVLTENQENFLSDKTKENNDLHRILNDINILMETHTKTLDTILDNQKKIMHKMASISVQVDSLQLQLSNMNEEGVVPLRMSKNREENMAFSFSPITTIEELSKTNDLLSDKAPREQLKKTFSIVCSGGTGINCAYKLIDIMFSRDFLCKCSWSGSSRSDGVKVSLKCYKNIVLFFWEMIFSWDQTFTLEDNELFFKSILKNSTKRKNAKQERSSTTRKRPKFNTNKSSTITDPNNKENNTGNVEQDANTENKLT